MTLYSFVNICFSIGNCTFLRAMEFHIFCIFALFLFSLPIQLIKLSTGISSLLIATSSKTASKEIFDSAYSLISYPSVSEIHFSIYFVNGICLASSTSTPYTKAAISFCICMSLLTIELTFFKYSPDKICVLGCSNISS